MNCKPGDLAIVVNSRRDVNLGRIVQCISLVDCVFTEIGRKVAWITEPMLINFEGIEVPCPDFQLRPLRPGDLEDEVPTSRELEAA